MLRVELTPLVVRYIVDTSVLSGDGLISPDLTGPEHRVNGTGEAASSRDPGDLPAEALSDLFV